MRLIKAKQILSNYSSGSYWFGMNYNINLYKGCSHGCIYCDSRSDCYRVDNFDEVRGKENALFILEEELKSKRKKGIVGNGAMSDPYNPFEKKYNFTRGSLELINKYRFGAGILTKADLVLRDIDILNKIKKHSPVMVNFTITTYDDNLCKIIEPNVTVSSKRFKAIEQLASNDIFTGVLIWPILPFINDNEENIKLLVRRAVLSGASFVIPCFGVTLRSNQRLYFYKQLDMKFPNLKEKYIKTYGKDYECRSLNYKRLNEVFINECLKHGIIYKMSDIISIVNKKYQKQISLF